MSDEQQETGPVGRPDREIEAALRAHFGDVPQDVDFDALNSRIVAAARFRLHARAARAGWQAPASRWARFAIPAALAASIALMLGLSFGPGGQSDSGSLAIEEVVAVAASDELPDDLPVVTDQAAFLSAVLDSGE